MTTDRDQEIESALAIMQYALRGIVQSGDCSYADVRPSERPVPCDCAHCVAALALRTAADWRFLGARHERASNGYNPREQLIVDAWRHYLTASGGQPDVRLASILADSEEGYRPIPTIRDWYVATSIVQWLATNVGSTILEAAGWRYHHYDQDRRTWHARTEGEPVIQVVSGLATRPDGTMLMTFRDPAGSRGAMWEHPGGKVEAGETPQQALAREWMEELGVHVEVGRRLDSTVLALDQVLDVTLYQVTITAGEPTPPGGPAPRWVALEELRTLPCTPGTYQFYRAIRRALEQR